MVVYTHILYMKPLTLRTMMICVEFQRQLKLSLDRLKTKMEDLKEAELATAETTQYVKVRHSFYYDTARFKTS